MTLFHFSDPASKCVENTFEMGKKNSSKKKIFKGQPRPRQPHHPNIDEVIAKQRHFSAPPFHLLQVTWASSTPVADVVNSARGMDNHLDLTSRLIPP